MRLHAARDRCHDRADDSTQDQDQVDYGVDWPDNKQDQTNLRTIHAPDQPFHARHTS
jgi:hypothetical protein